MAGVLLTIMVFTPDPNIDYSLIEQNFSWIETYSGATEDVLSAAAERLEELFPGAAVTYDVATCKVSMVASGVDRSKAQAFIEAMMAVLRFASA